MHHHPEHIIDHESITSMDPWPAARVPAACCSGGIPRIVRVSVQFIMTLQNTPKKLTTRPPIQTYRRVVFVR